MSALRRSLLLLTAASWAVAPLALLLAQADGFSHSRQVLVFLFAVATQAPFLVLLNEALAPAVVRGGVDRRTKAVLIPMMAISLFAALMASLTRMEVLGLPWREAALAAMAGMFGALISYSSSLRLLNQIVTVGSAPVSVARLTMLGAMPGIVVLAVFAIYALVRSPQGGSAVELMIPAILLPNIAHFAATRLTLRRLEGCIPHSGVQLAGALDGRAIMIFLVACVALPATAYWSNTLRENLGQEGPTAWILLLTNMAFTATLVVSKLHFLGKAPQTLPLSSNAIHTTSLPVGLLLVAAASKALSIQWLGDISMLLLTFVITIFIVTLCRNWISRIESLTA